MKLAFSLNNSHGYDIDAANIREAINLIKAYDSVWGKIESSIYKRLNDGERYNDSRIKMLARTKQKNGGIA